VNWNVRGDSVCCNTGVTVLNIKCMYKYLCVGCSTGLTVSNIKNIFIIFVRNKGTTSRGYRKLTLQVLILAEHSDSPCSKKP
jgi:hypothetical protein